MLALLAVAFSAARAGTVSLVANDTVGTTSFTNNVPGAVTNWSSGQAPSKGNSYFTAGHLLRTPAIAADCAFAGDSLQLDAQLTDFCALGFKGTSNVTVTISDLRLNGGNIGASSDTMVYTLAGRITSVSAVSGFNASTTASGKTRTLVIAAPISGSSGLVAGAQTSGTISGTVVVSGDNSSFSGGWTLGGVIANGTNLYGQNMTLKVNHPNALGTGPLVVNDGVLDLNGFSPSIGSLAGNASTILNNGGGTAILALGDDGSSTVFGGTIKDRSSSNGVVALVKTGAGTLTLSGPSTYTGGTIVSNGSLLVNGSLGGGAVLVRAGASLGGAGAIGGSVAVAGTLAPGGPGLGTLAIAGNLDLTSVALFEINKASLPVSDAVSVGGSLTVAGTLVITNSGWALAAGDVFYLFNKPVTGSFASVILPAGYEWTNRLAIDGSIQVLSAPPVHLATASDGTTVHVAWPANTRGWLLQSQTNTLAIGVSTNWVDLAGSETNLSMTLPVEPGVPTRFLRLRCPPPTTPDYAVRPLDWSRFSAGVPSDANALRLIAILRNACRYAMTTWWTNNYASQDAGYYLNFGGTGETQIRKPAMEAYGLAIALQLGVYDPAHAGVSADLARNRTLKLVRSLGYTHLANQSGGWGNAWQSAHWAALAGTGGWLMWTNLTAVEQEYVRRMVQYEANRFNAYTVPYYMNRAGTIVYPGDTKCEENAWNSSVLHLALCMMPAHTNAPLWRTKALELTLSAYARPSDINRTNVYHGRSLAAWLNGSNANEDSTVINHSLVHPDYMVAGLGEFPPALVYLLAGRPVPQASFFNLDETYRAFVDLDFIAGSTPYPVGGALLAPGGFVYARDAANQPSTNIYYPQGNDWGTSRRMHFAAMDAIVHAFGRDNLASIPGDVWEALHGQSQLDMQARFSDGHTYGAAGEDTYALREEWVCHFAGKSLLTKWLAGQGTVQVSNDP